MAGWVAVDTETDGLTVSPGGSAKLKVKLARRDYDGPIALAIEDAQLDDMAAFDLDARDGRVFESLAVRILEVEVLIAQRLEGQIERHHLGDRGGVAGAVGPSGVKDFAGRGVHAERADERTTSDVTSR